MLQSFEAQAAHAPPSRRYTSGLRWWFPPPPRSEKCTGWKKRWRVSRFQGFHFQKLLGPFDKPGFFQSKETTPNEVSKGREKVSWWTSTHNMRVGFLESRGSFFTVSRDVSSTVCCVKHTAYRHAYAGSNKDVHRYLLTYTYLWGGERKPARVFSGVAVWKGLHVSLEILENASVRKLQEKEHFDRVITGDTANHEQVFRNSPVFISGTSSSDTFDTRRLLHQTTFSLNTVYNRHLLHQTPCRPDTFYTRHIFTRHLLHPTPLTPNTFYTKHLLYQTPFKPGTFYTRHLLHPTPFTPDNFFTKHILQQAPFTPNTLYTRHLLYQAHLHQTPFTPCVNHPPPPHPLLILTSFARWNYA